MLSHQQVLHFRTFGYVVLRGLLSPAEAATLHREVTGALADAFGKIATEPDDLGGISGDYLPLAASRAPFSLALIADDERTFGSSAELLGGPAVPSVGIATCFTGDSTWHTRHGPDIGGVTLWADLERRTAGTGALRLIPGSHLPEFERRLCEYRAAEPAASGFGDWEWPHVVVATEPGDVVAFHAHLMTCAQGGTPRLSWTIDYLPWPGLGRPDQMAVVRDLAHETQLVLLGALADHVARPRRGEAALGRQRELFAREEAPRLVDAGGELVWWFHPVELRRDQAEHHHLVVGDVAKGRKGAGALIVVLEQEYVVVGRPLEELLGDGLVGAGADPVAVGVSPAQVKAECDAGNRGSPASRALPLPPSSAADRPRTARTGRCRRHVSAVATRPETASAGSAASP